MKKLTRESVQPERYPVKVLQFGDGNFLRAFADWMIDVLNEQTSFKGSVAVVAPLRRGRQGVKDEQEGLYHVLLRGVSEGKPVDEIRMITCVDGYVDPYDGYDAFMATADLPSLQFVISNTTEAGIAFLATDVQTGAPVDSFPAKVAQLLFRRFRTFDGDPSKGLIFLPCELIEANGTTLQKVVLQYAVHWHLPQAFSTWVRDACLFCNTLVDRIVTGYPGDGSPQIMERIGYRDERLVAAEPFYLWVIEADPSLNDVFPVREANLNVRFVSDLTPYRTSKVRILNGAHTAMTLVGYLRGLRTVREAIEDRWMADFVDSMVSQEVIPTIPLPAEEVKLYAEQVFERFHNPEIRHELKSIALNSLSKFRTRLLPTLLDRYDATGQIPPRLLYTFASLIVFYQGKWKGETLPVNDHPDALKIMEACWDANGRPQLTSLLSNEALWGVNLTYIKGLDDILTATVTSILKDA
ncbi:MAG TPA: tagaturonate reductase [Chryseolinea sp.]|nr:tagaturonate reductase [Chryseolinea sp.]